MRGASSVEVSRAGQNFTLVFCRAEYCTGRILSLQFERGTERSLSTELEIGREPRHPLIAGDYQVVCLQDPCQIRPSTRLHRLMSYTG
ncbi:hypothetical protein Y032_0278g1155 [Ancylostoma ceylanicum]|uniref:Uncharacterized protein n=1 Tax=Ancylostoma ceylanicum TaxID=53326 RepID=A0A016S7P3_9BILA|nr:hypothetical protein Y032_0278g1155 [Ancylostoma ceylanicum]